MSNEFAAPRFPDGIVFPDVEAECLAEEEATCRAAPLTLTDSSAWKAYLRKVLPPLSNVAAS